MPSFRLVLVRLWPSVFNNANAYAGSSKHNNQGPGANGYGHHHNLSWTVASVTSRRESNPSHERLGSRDGVITCSRSYKVEFSRSEDSGLAAEHGVVCLDDLKT